MTHDLINDILGQLEVSCSRVSVTELRENTFYASITLQMNGRRSRSTRAPPMRWRLRSGLAPRSSPPRT